MRKGLFSRLTIIATAAFGLAGCLGEDDGGAPAIEVTNISDVAVIETPDISISLYGTAESEHEITNVSWKNDRGGNGIANGKERWATGRIGLKDGQNVITLTAKDIAGNVNTKTVTVARQSSQSPGVNSAPVISGKPNSRATVGVLYSFRPNAHDPDGDTLTFTAKNLPKWLELDPSSGRLHGTPTNLDIGQHGGMSITVSDGTTTSTLPTFAITVESISNGAATLTWNPPSQRTDNTPLNSDLAGFQIEYGPASGSFDNVIRINNAGLSSYMVENLSAGTWKFVVRAFDRDGRLSAPSAEGRKSIL